MPQPDTPPTDPLELVTAAEAAATLKCTTRTITRYADAGTLPTARKLPGRTGARLFHRSDVDRLAEQLEAAS